MIIVFLKYSSVRRVQEPKQVKEVEKPVPKEITTETRVVHDAGVQSEMSPVVVEAHLSESLG